MHRIVHLDLKGAPWKVHYLEQVILLAKQWGATGVLFEWEDTFPYIGALVEIGSVGGSGGDGMYTVEEVQHLMSFVKDQGLEAIQLVQTIGHMEFVLKHPSLRPLRECPRSAGALCPSRPASGALVRAMLQQALDLQPDARYLHIGADEVWHMAICPECKQRAETSKHGKACLYLDHIRDVAVFVKQQRPDIVVLMWDDMLRSIALDTLKEYKLGELVTPVVWHYNAKDSFQIDPSLWQTYRQEFPTVWAGSAFKGANGSCCIVSPASRYASNHEAWRDEIQRYNTYIHFAGVILTGWSRYDHYATLCELLPVSLPSLASCLSALAAPHARNNVSECVLPGGAGAGGLARDVQAFAQLRDRCSAFVHGDLVATWLNDWQLLNNYTHPLQIEGIGTTAQLLIRELHPLQECIKSQLLEITGKRSAEEWINTLGTPILNKLYEIRNTVESRLQLDAGITPSTYTIHKS